MGVKRKPCHRLSLEWSSAESDHICWEGGRRQDYDFGCICAAPGDAGQKEVRPPSLDGSGPLSFRHFLSGVRRLTAEIAPGFKSATGGVGGQRRKAIPRLHEPA